MSVYITDYVTDPSIEREILGSLLVDSPTQGVNVLLVWHEHIDANYLKQFPKLKGVVRYGVGFDNLNLYELGKRGIVACNTPDYGTDEVSDTALAMILNLTRGITRYNYLSKGYTDGSWQTNTLRDLTRTKKMTLGIIGSGRIGSSVLLKSKAIGFNTCFYDPYVSRGYEKVLNARRLDTLVALLECSDVISIHVPLSTDTEGMIDAEFLEAMKPGSWLVNTARGELLSDLDILVDPLRSGHLAGVALDVLPQEPPDPAKSRLISAWMQDESWTQGRVLINPHSAYYSKESFIEMRAKAASNAKRILDGLKPFNILGTPQPLF